MNSGHPFRTAVVHYHWRRGGVTRVIETACRALTAAGLPVVVLCGEKPETPFPEDAGRLCVIPGLGYHAEACCERADIGALQQTVIAAAREALDGVPDVWHFHNATLGKNPAVSCLLHALARDGAAVLSQIHDFAEDQRPGNWHFLLRTVGAGSAAILDQRLYPVAPQVRLAVLNERDRRILLQAGAPARSLALLPNPVTAPAEPMANEADEMPDDAHTLRHWLYPTRAIRRKNLGEFILWAAVAAVSGRDRDRFATTLVPTNPRDVTSYRAWKRIAESLRLPIRFGAGLKGEAAFRRLLGEATALTTTSVAEGFGLAFAEPWLLGKPVAGRRLPEITTDMEETGVDLSMLYDRLELPLEWIGRDRLQRCLADGLAHTFQSYDVTAPQRARERSLAAIECDGRVDFGGLNESLQQEVVRRVAGSPAAADQLLPAFLETASVHRSLIARNRRLVSEHYSPAAYGERLKRLYADLLRERGDLSYVPATAVLQQFLQPERFRLLRME